MALDNIEYLFSWESLLDFLPLWYHFLYLLQFFVSFSYSFCNFRFFLYNANLSHLTCLRRLDLDETGVPESGVEGCAAF